MDIFTTALTRVVPVPIKPANLKVKALLKEAGTGKLKEDLDHLENHDYYFAESKVDEKQEKQHEQEHTQELAEQSQSASTDKSNDSIEEQDESNKTIKHLDLYV